MSKREMSEYNRGFETEWYPSSKTRKEDMGDDVSDRSSPNGSWPRRDPSNFYRHEDFFARKIPIYQSHRRSNAGPIPDTRDSEEDSYTSPKRRTQLILILTVVGVTLLVGVAIIIAVMLANSGDPPSVVQGKVTGKITNKKYLPIYNDTSSQEFLDLQTELCSEVGFKLETEYDTVGYQGCSLVSVRNGSLVVVLVFQFKGMSASAVSTSISNMFRPSGSPETVSVESFIFLVSSVDIVVISLKESEAGQPAVEPVNELPSTSLTTTTISTQDVSTMSSEKESTSSIIISSTPPVSFETASVDEESSASTFSESSADMEESTSMTIMSESKVTPETTSAVSTDFPQATGSDFEEMSTSVNSVMSESKDELQPTSTRTDSMTSSENEDSSFSSKSTIENPQSSTTTLDLQSSSQAAEAISSSLTIEDRSSQSTIPSSVSILHVESSSLIMDIQSSDSIMRMQSTEELTDSSTVGATTSLEIASLSSMETELTTSTGSSLDKESLSSSTVVESSSTMFDDKMSTTKMEEPSTTSIETNSKSKIVESSSTRTDVESSYSMISSTDIQPTSTMLDSSTSLIMGAESTSLLSTVDTQSSNTLSDLLTSDEASVSDYISSSELMDITSSSMTDSIFSTQIQSSVLVTEDLMTSIHKMSSKGDIESTENILSMDISSLVTSEQVSLMEPSSLVTSEQDSMVEPPSLVTSEHVSLMEPSSLLTSEQFSMVEPSSVVTSEHFSWMEPSSLVTSEQFSMIEPSSVVTSEQVSLMQSSSVVTSDQVLLMESSSVVTSEPVSLMEPSSLVTSEQDSIVEPPSLVTSEQVSLMEPSSLLTSEQFSMVEPSSVVTSEHFSWMEPSSLVTSDQVSLMQSSSVVTSEPVSLMEPSSMVTSEQATLIEPSSLMTTKQASLMESSSCTLALTTSSELMSDLISITGSVFSSMQSVNQMTPTISILYSDVSDISSRGNSYLSSEYHETTMDKSTIEISSTIEPSSTSEFASSSVLLPVYALSMDDVIGVENVTTTLECKLEGKLTLNSVKFLKDEEELTGTIEQNDENTNFQYTLPSTTCTDSGIYHCLVEGEEANLTATANITIQVPVGKPTITVPFEIVEERFKEGSLFVCTFKEGIPAAQVRWTATNTTEHVLELLSHNFKEENQTDECALEATSQFYYGFTLDYNGSNVCCEVQQGNISFSSCETIYIVDKDFCINKTNQIYEHPYSRRTWISCVNDVVYMNQCGVGYCINVATGACEDCGDSPEPNDPLSCVGRNYAYIPRETTYPDNCGDYDRCVNGDKQPGTCAGSFLSNDTSSFLCTNNYEESYCAHVGGLSTDSSGTTMETSTIETSSTIGPSSTYETNSTIGPSSTYETTTPSVLLSVYTLSMDDVIGVENVTTTLVCRLEGNLTFNSVSFFKDEQELTGMIEQNDENTNFRYTLPSPTCTDSGIYYCLVKGEEANLTESADVTIQVPTGKPTIKVPFEIVEKRFKETTQFVCTYKEGIPAVQVRWSATSKADQVLELSSTSFKEENQTDECALEATLKFYYGFTLDYNGSSVCCEVNQGNITFSSCETIYIVDKDFCVNKTNQIYEHPYSRRTWITCANGVIYMNQCGVGDCINVATGGCGTCEDSPESSDPLSCVGRNYAYIPRETTYPDNCGDYDRCVNGDKQPGTCAGSFLRNDTSSFLCTNKYEESYCAHVGGEQGISTGTMETQTTVPPSKCECGIKQYIPSDSTYPDNCRTYVRCVNGEKIVHQCTEGYFVYFNIYEEQVTCIGIEGESYCSKVNASIIEDC